jgi:hypothetical protein
MDWLFNAPPAAAPNSPRNRPLLRAISRSLALDNNLGAPNGAPSVGPRAPNGGEAPGQGDKFKLDEVVNGFLGALQTDLEVRPILSPFSPSVDANTSD